MKGDKKCCASPCAHSFLAALAALIIVFLQMLTIMPDFNLGDSFAYLSVAKNLADTGIFTDGNYAAQAAVTGAQGQGMFFAPLYPALLALIMKLDPGFYAAAACHLAKGGAECTQGFGALALVHGVLAALSAYLVWLAAWVISGRRRVAWLAMALSLMAEAYAYYTGQIMTENIVFPLFTLTTLLFAVAYKKRQSRYWLLTGLAYGALALARPSFVYLFYASVMVCVVILIGTKPLKLHRKMFFLLALLTGYTAVAGPWVIRNGMELGQYAISKGYASYILAQRVAYNAMTPEEWEASFIYSLPDFGDSLAEEIFPPEDYERLDYSNPEGFYVMGNGAFMEETKKKAGGKQHHLAYLIKTEILGNIVQHVKVTFSLVWRGMWVSKYWGLVAIPVFFGVFVHAARHWREERWSAFLLFSMPPWFMLGFHAFTSVNVVRYNLILIPSLALAVAFTLAAVSDKIRKKRG